MASEKDSAGRYWGQRERRLGPQVPSPGVAGQPGVRVDRRMHHPEGKRRGIGSQVRRQVRFHDHRDMLAHPEIDAVAVVVRVPQHYQLTLDALNAGKHVFTEWPLGATLVEAQELADLARAKGVQTMVGLQARAAPGVTYMKELVERATWARLCPVT